MILEALAHFNPEPRDGAFRLLERAQHRLEQGRGPGQSNMQYEIAGSAYGGGMRP